MRECGFSVCVPVRFAKFEAEAAASFLVSNSAVVPFSYRQTDTSVLFGAGEIGRKARAKRRFALGQEGAVARSGVAHWALAGAPKRN